MCKCLVITLHAAKPRRDHVFASECVKCTFIFFFFFTSVVSHTYSNVIKPLAKYIDLS